MFKIFVIIVTYKGKLWYDRCFNSLRKSDIPVQTIVVDNASTDDTVEYIRANFPEIHLIESNINLGFGQGNNKGMRYALDQGADYVFLLNQDAWIEPNTIMELIRIHKENQQFGILSPMHLNAAKNAIEKGLMHYIADYRTTSTDLVNDLYFNNLQDVYETLYVNAAAWLLPKKTIETVGGFDPIFFHYGEDDNYMQRVIYHGKKIGICPNIRAVHDTERSVNKNKKSQQNKDKNLLVDLTDINKNININKLLITHFIKGCMQYFLLKTKPAYYNMHLVTFLFLNKKRILFSREKNLYKSTTWL